jgi:transposase
MAYFLKKSNLKKGLYLQIYESFYDCGKKETAHRSHKAIGYVDALIASGISDPVFHFSGVVNEMNHELRLRKQMERERKISSSPEKHVGHFLLKAVFDKLNVKGYLDILQLPRSFRFRVSDLIESLVYCRVVEPCSKSKTANMTLPSLYDAHVLSYEQILDGVCYIGGEYEKIIEIMNHQLALKYPVDTSTTYFDGTNFYFEIDREDELRRKGPSKENRKDPIIGLGLLLDAYQIPIGMKLHPGNESERPLLREVIQDLKNRNNITGRTVQVADKGLNCAGNILAARQAGDGYIFSKSVKMLPDTEKTWVLLGSGYRDVLDSEGRLLYKLKECVDKFPYTYVEESTGKKATVRVVEKRVVSYNPKLAEKKRYEINRMVEKARGLTASRAKKNEFGECGKYVVFDTTDKQGNPVDGKVAVSINHGAVDEDLALAGYNLFVSSETTMSAQEIHATYRNLWRIEESFKVMKSYLDARPVFLQKKFSIYGHFLICYLAVLLLRILQFHVFKNSYSTEQLVDYIKNFKVVELQQHIYINLTPDSDLVSNLANDLALPLANYFLHESHLKKIFNLTL